MPAWLSKACAESNTGNQGAKGQKFVGNTSQLNYCRSFDPVCKEDPQQPWYRLPDPLSAKTGGKSPVRAGDVEGRCTGDWTDGVIVDNIVIPDLPAGDYVIVSPSDCSLSLLCCALTRLLLRRLWAGLALGLR